MLLRLLLLQANQLRLYQTRKFFYFFSFFSLAQRAPLEKEKKQKFKAPEKQLKIDCIR